jgi:hypothetical protein
MTDTMQEHVFNYESSDIIIDILSLESPYSTILCENIQYFNKKYIKNEIQNENKNENNYSYLIKYELTKIKTEKFNTEKFSCKFKYPIEILDLSLIELHKYCVAHNFSKTKIKLIKYEKQKHNDNFYNRYFKGKDLNN